MRFITEACADYPLGLLSPDGKYYPVEFATHEESAQELAQELFPEEWDAEYERKGWVDGLPFLRNRGWVDIHSDGNVRHSKEINQTQCNFIFDLAMARRERAGKDTYEVRELVRAIGMDVSA